MTDAKRPTLGTFSTTPSEADIAEAIKDIKGDARIDVDRISDRNLIYIATVWHCLNQLRRTLSKGSIADLMVAYLGIDEVAYWWYEQKGTKKPGS